MVNLGRNSFSFRSTGISKRTILVGLLFFLVLEAGLLSFLSKRANKLSDKSTSTEGRAILKLQPKEGKFKVGEEFKTEVILDTGNYKTDATDFRLSFDPKVLVAVRIEEGKTYDSYLAKRIDQIRGELIVNAIAPESKTFEGQGVFATVYWRGVKEGQTELKINFIPGVTTDTNVVATEVAKDILGEVENASFKITPK